MLFGLCFHLSCCHSSRSGRPDTVSQRCFEGTPRRHASSKRFLRRRRLYWPPVSAQQHTNYNIPRRGRFPQLCATGRAVGRAAGATRKAFSKISGLHSREVPVAMHPMSIQAAHKPSIATHPYGRGCTTGCIVARPPLSLWAACDKWANLFVHWLHTPKKNMDCGYASPTVLRCNQTTFGPPEGQNVQWRGADRRRQRQTI